MKKAGLQYYHEAKDDAELKKWLAKPKGNVPENLLPAIKASFNCYSQGNRKEFMKLLDKQTVPASARLDPTFENFKAELEDFIKKAKANPGEDYVKFYLYAGHGYHTDGF